MKTRDSGFTLIEMVIVILIIAVLSVEVLTQTTTTAAPMSVAAAASQIADDVRYTQALSMFSGQRYFFAAVSGNFYSIQNVSGTAIILANGSTITSFPAGVNFGAVTGFTNLIGFNGRGVPITDTGGTLLTTTGTVVVTNGTFSQTITVSPVTGRLVIS